MVCTFDNFIKPEGLLKVTNSHIHCKIVQGRYMLLQTANRKLMYYVLSNRAICGDLE